MIICQYENNDKVSLRHVTVNAIIVNDQGQILLGKRGTYKGKPISEYGKWGLIGGFFDRDENLIQAVKREALEESGWKIDNLELLRINDRPDRPKEDRQNVDIIFIAKAISKLQEVNEEVRELKWFSIYDLPQQADFAFDHGENVQIYLKYLNEKIDLPILG